MKQMQRSATSTTESTASRRDVLAQLASLSVVSVSTGAWAGDLTLEKPSSSDFFAITFGDYQSLMGSAFEFWTSREAGGASRSARALLMDAQQRRSLGRDSGIGLESIWLRFAVVEQTRVLPSELCQVMHSQFGRFEAYVQPAAQSNPDKNSQSELVVLITRFA
jgi:hypothetical protein